MSELATCGAPPHAWGASLAVAVQGVLQDAAPVAASHRVHGGDNAEAHRLTPYACLAGGAYCSPAEEGCNLSLVQSQADKLVAFMHLCYQTTLILTPYMWINLG